MTTTIDVLGILHAFENMQASKTLSDVDKKAIARELLGNVPEEIIAPSCKNTSSAVRKVIREYLGLTDGPTKAAKAEGESAPREAERPSEEPKAEHPDREVGGPRVASEAHRTPQKADPRKGKARRNA